MIDSRPVHICGVNLQLYEHLIGWVLRMSWIKKEFMLAAMWRNEEVIEMIQMNAQIIAGLSHFYINPHRCGVTYSGYYLTRRYIPRSLLFYFELDERAECHLQQGQT